MRPVEKTIFSEETSRKDADGRSEKGIEQYRDDEKQQRTNNTADSHRVNNTIQSPRNHIASTI